MAGPLDDYSRQQTACHLLVLVGMKPNILSYAVRWLLERIEHFPIPLEEALWAYADASSAPAPGGRTFSFPPPSSQGCPGKFKRAA
jgi:hypothetical protein